MKPRLHLVILLGLSLVLVLGQAVVAQEPGPTPSPQSPVPNVVGVPEQPSAQPQQRQSMSATGETLIVPFGNGTAGVQTAGSYSGPVMVTVSGVGQAAGTSMSDAFYIYTDDAGNPIIPWHPTEFYNWTLWINGGPADNFVSPIPPYNPEHVYTFEMLAPGGPLTFAVGDTYTIDNTGAYTVSVVPLLVAVDVDVKPGSDPNAINPRNRGVIPVAIVTTEDFDATTVDPLSVEFGPGGAKEAHGTGHVEDVDRDGDLDLMLHFKTQETGIQCGDTSATLIGETFDGQRIEGSDSVVTVGCK